jgi:ABC-type nitrate/sulfonate/bicarbonate transport system permease component
MAAAMARVEDQASLASAEADLTQAAARRLDVAFRGGAAIFSILVLLIGWELFARSGKVTMFMLPPFTTVLEYIKNDATTLQSWTLTIFGHTLTMNVATLWINLAVTLYRAMVGFAIAAVGGITLATLMSRVRLIRWFFDPIISVGFPMPKIAFLPVIILWLGVYDVSKICIVIFDSIFPVLTATLAGIAAVEKELVWSARNMGANERELTWQVVLPAASPQILTGLQVALPIALIVEIVAEMVMGGYGLGGAMMTASRFANSPGVFAGLVEIAVVGFILIKVMAMLRRRLLIWHQEAA